MIEVDSDVEPGKMGALDEVHDADRAEQEVLDQVNQILNENDSSDFDVDDSEDDESESKSL